MNRDRHIPTGVFLRDVLVCSLGAYGGPEAHMSVFLHQMVSRRRYLSEEELIELIALCSLLPGPTSTQTIVSIGYKIGGPRLAALTMAVWALPVLLVMSALSFLYGFLDSHEVSTDFLRYVGAMAVGFIVVAAIRIGRRVVTDLPTGLLLLLGALTTYFIRAPWIFPAVLVAGAIATNLLSREAGRWTPVHVRPQWPYLIAFGTLAVASMVAGGVSDNPIATLFASFYRYGYLVFGGGQVVVPLMHSELVDLRHAMTDQQFLTGYGLVQGLPGPMFSFAAYAGGMAARGGSAGLQVLGAAVGGVAIFLPGLLLIYFVYPLWEEVKQIKAVRISLRGINAVAGGLIAAAAVILMQASGWRPAGLAVTAATAGLLYFTRLPAPVLVVGALAAGLLSELLT